ncbi:MAG: DUF4180 domain-containing protein [Hespellia sp.]|nr:DUF4180 domain-containing protein [Hespellia sp.]
MKTEVIAINNTEVAVVSSNELLITDVQSALDLIMTVKYETGYTNIAINKGAISDIWRSAFRQTAILVVHFILLYSFFDSRSWFH